MEFMKKNDMKGLTKLTKKKVENMHEKIQRYKEKADSQNAIQPSKVKDKGGEIIAP